MALVDLSDVDVMLPCPKCTYSMFCLLSEVESGIYLICPACRNLIRLHDQDASIFEAEADIENLLRDLFKGF